jgi:hypothetical protein
VSYCVLHGPITWRGTGQGETRWRERGQQVGQRGGRARQRVGAVDPLSDCWVEAGWQLGRCGWEPAQKRFRKKKTFPFIKTSYTLKLI